MVSIVIGVIYIQCVNEEIKIKLSSNLFSFIIGTHLYERVMVNMHINTKSLNILHQHLSQHPAGLCGTI